MEAVGCQMVVTIYQGLMKLFPPTWQHHRLMIASTVVPIIQWQMSLIPGEDQHGKTNPRRDASLLPCTLRSPRRKRAHVVRGSQQLPNDHNLSSVKNSILGRFELGR